MNFDPEKGDTFELTTILLALNLKVVLLYTDVLIARLTVTFMLKLLEENDFCADIMKTEHAVFPFTSVNQNSLVLSQSIR